MATQAELAELKRDIKELGQRMDQQMVLIQGLIKESPQAFHMTVNGAKLCPEDLFKRLAKLHEAHTHPKEVIGSSLCDCKAKDGSTLQSRRRGQPRTFSCLPAPLASVYEELLDAGIIKPLTPTVLPKVLPASHNPKQFCAFHQMPGHSTNKCFRLRHEIQDLIDGGVISPPPPLEADAVSNPRPQLKSDPPNGQTTLNSTQTSLNSTQNNLSSTIHNPSHNITPETQPEPVVSIAPELEVSIWAMSSRTEGEAESQKALEEQPEDLLIEEVLWKPKCSC